MSWILYAIDLVALAAFASSYYFNCYRKGYRIDIWHSQLFLVCIVPNLLMLPFAWGDENIIVVGRDWGVVAAAIPAVFLITLLGYAAVLLGGSLWRLHIGLGLRKAAVNFLDILPRCSMMLMSSRSLLVFQALICLFLQVFVLTLNYTQRGFNFDVRGYGFENPTLRPVIQIIFYYSTLIASHCLARYVDLKEKVLLVCNLALALGLVLFGSRGGLIAVYLGVLLCWLIRRRKKISLLRLGLLAVFILSIAFYLGQVRAGAYSLGEFFAGIAFLLLYGNNFSDLRDFAWVYAFWNHSFWFGKTYLAALLAFVPRFASTFRNTWGLGVATATTVGFDPEVHPGLRPGSFGEGFFNFGVIGVLIVGLAVGVIIRRVDIDVKRVFESDDPSIMRAFATTMQLSLASTLALSANSSGLLVTGIIFAFSWVCLRLLEMVQPGAKGARKIA
jgi:oligosaccharide repeat unit polymerase